MNIYSSRCQKCEFKDEDVDEWFYSSISKYKNLQMYDLQMVPQCLVDVSDNRLCLAGHHADRSELICTELPRKLLLSDEESGRCKSNDFEISAGKFFDGIVRKVAVTKSGEMSVAGFEGESSLRKLRIQSDDTSETTDFSEEIRILTGNPMLEPNFTAHPDQNEIVVCKTSADALIRLDLSCDEEYSHHLPTAMNVYRSNNVELSPLYTGSTTVALLNTSSGCWTQLDLRCAEESGISGKGNQNSSKFTFAVWGTQIATLSSGGLFTLHDLRRTDGFIFSRTLRDEVNFEENLAKPKIAFSTSGKLSVSGLNNNSLRIYDLNDEVKILFTHEGHSYVDGTQCSCRAVISDHLWLPNIDENCIVSCSSNGSLNCWTFKL